MVRFILINIFTLSSVYLKILISEYKKGEKKKKTKKRVLNLSIVISIFLTFLVTPNNKEFGAPFLWVTYYGDKALESSLFILKPSNMVISHFNMFAFAVNILIIYLLIFYGIKIMKTIYTI